MPASYDHISDEEELHKMMNATEDFEERKAIRARLRQIRDKQREEMEAKRKEREARAEDHVKKKFLQAEEEKKKKMEAYKHVAPTHERESSYLNATQKMIEEKQKLADADKAAKMAAYSNTKTTVGPDGEKITTSIVTEKTAGGSVAVVKKTVDRTGGGPGSALGAASKPAAKPQGAKGAMAAFKQMDNAANPNPARPNGLLAVSLAKKAATTMRRNAVAIKQEILYFCKMNTQEYETLDPKQRRKNFELAFDTAEKEADIAPLLDVEDMVRMKTPDWKCVFTYVQSLYRHLKDHPNNKTVSVEQ
ncbi:smoothelin [Plakobranchus ocellatus]|uniref:Smoothelin n=1 Tax=Plakobranchus ocellatus TaxID=259542 RepID=A0AAV4BXV1_9GAST|nr:smoothelin [Plakobranchus ocellatus]